MKVTPEHLERLRSAIAPLDTPELRARYVAGDFPRADAVRNLNMRYRWDLWHAAGGTSIVPKMYDYANDSHIDTALRAIVPVLDGVS